MLLLSSVGPQTLRATTRLRPRVERRMASQKFRFPRSKPSASAPLPPSSWTEQRWSNRTVITLSTMVGVLVRRALSLTNRRMRLDFYRAITRHSKILILHHKIQHKKGKRAHKLHISHGPYKVLHSKLPKKNCSQERPWVNVSSWSPTIF